MKFILLSAAIILSQLAIAQNTTDAQGKKQGNWVVYGKDKPDDGHCATCKVEEGKYVDGRKEGRWIKYFPDGVTPRLDAHYVGGQPNGDYIKYHENGVIKEKSSYHNRKQSGPFIIMNEQGIVTQEKTFDDNGQIQGVEKFYYDDGSIQMVITKKDGVAQGTSTTYWENGDVKKEITFGPDGKALTTVNKEMVNPSTVKVVKGSGGPDGGSGIIKDGKKYDRDGYNKLYNKADELWMDGNFKSGKLWDGKYYKYDSDGILLKIEIWKEGKYHSDGHLE